jgi:hypothetical protein
MSFGLDVKRFSAKAANRAREVADLATHLAWESIVEGSPITGAPGQPVDAGALKGSWTENYGKLKNEILQNNPPLIYAPMIEDGTRAGRALTLRSQVGGFHSLALTRIAWGKLVDEAVRRTSTP